MSALRPPHVRVPPSPLSTRIVTPRLVLRAPRTADVSEVRRHMRENSEHLRPWSPNPLPGEDPSSLTALSSTIVRQRREWRRGDAYVFYVTAREPGEPIVGRVAFTGIVRAAFQSAYLGYWIDGTRKNQGLTTEAVTAALGFAFEMALLHRVQAAIMPHNGASLRVVEKLGFRHEGDSQRYLFIGGAWQDHRIFALTYEDWLSRNRESVSAE